MQNNNIQKVDHSHSHLPLVSIIIPVYNGEQYLEKLIASLKEQTYHNVEIIAVDNRSTDSSAKILNSFRTKVPIKIVSNERNEGYCGGCNRGIGNSNGEFLLFLSQDRIIEPDWLKKTIARMLADSKIGCVLGKVLREGASTPEYGHAYDIYGAVLIKGSPEESNLFFAGGTVLVRRSVIEKIGGFDPEFFVYHEDVDLSWRIRLAGFAISIVEDAICRNIGGGISDTFNNKGGLHVSFDRELISMPVYKFYYSQRNRIRTMLKNYSRIRIFKRLPIAIGIIFLRGLFMSFITKRSEYIFAVFRGLWWNTTHLQSTMKHRNEIQRMRVVDDATIEKYMIKQSIELASMKMVRNSLFSRNKHKST